MHDTLLFPGQFATKLTARYVCKQYADLVDCFCAVPGFSESVRRHILRSVAVTFQKVTKATLAEYLRLDGSALDELVSSIDPFRSGDIQKLPQSGEPL